MHLITSILVSVAISSSVVSALPAPKPDNLPVVEVWGSSWGSCHGEDCTITHDQAVDEPQSSDETQNEPHDPEDKREPPEVIVWDSPWGSCHGEDCEIPHKREAATLKDGGGTPWYAPWDEHPREEKREVESTKPEIIWYADWVRPVSGDEKRSLKAKRIVDPAEPEIWYADWVRPVTGGGKPNPLVDA